MFYFFLYRLHKPDGRRGGSAYPYRREMLDIVEVDVVEWCYEHSVRIYASAHVEEDFTVRRIFAADEYYQFVAGGKLF